VQKHSKIHDRLLAIVKTHPLDDLHQFYLGLNDDEFDTMMDVYENRSHLDEELQQLVREYGIRKLVNGCLECRMHLFIGKIERSIDFNESDADFIEKYIQKIDSKKNKLYAFYGFDYANDLREFIAKFITNYTENIKPVDDAHPTVNLNLNWIDVSSMYSLDDMFSNTTIYGDQIDDEFYDCVELFDGDISLWDTSNVESMNGTFRYSYFDGDLSQWDTTNVEDMYEMFASAEYRGLNGSIAGWPIGNVQTMESMFYASRIAADLSKWKVPENCSMYNMYANCQIRDEYKPKHWDRDFE